MAVDMALVKKLREQTGIAILECKKAMEAAENDFEKAEELLRKKGFEKAKKKSARSANDGIIAIHTTEKSCVMTEVNCETDFVAKNEDFVSIAKDIAAQLAKNPVADNDVETLLAQNSLKDESLTVEKQLAEAIHKMGENIVVKRFTTINAEAPVFFGTYVHTNGKIGVSVEFGGNGESDEAKAMAKDVAMQVAAMNPLYLNESTVPQDAIEKEKDIFREQMKASGKPENVIEKIVEGKIGKFYSENCLVDQKFFKNDKMSINDLIKETAEKTGSEITVRNFTRFVVGEEN